MSHLDVESKIDEILGITKKSHHHITKPKPDYNELVRWDRVRGMAIPASNLLDDVNVFAPEKFFFWDIKRITVQGFSAGSVACYYESITGDEIFNFTSAGTYLPEDKSIVIRTRIERPVFQATGLSGTAIVSMSYISVHASIWGKYLAGG